MTHNEARHFMAIPKQLQYENDEMNQMADLNENNFIFTPRKIQSMEQ